MECNSKCWEPTGPQVICMLSFFCVEVGLKIFSEVCIFNLIIYIVIYGSQDPKPLGFVGRLTCSGLWCKTWGQNFTSSLDTTSHLQPGNFALLCLCTSGYLNCDPCQLSGISMLGKLSKLCSRSALGCGAVGFGVRQRTHDTSRFRL